MPALPFLVRFTLLAAHSILHTKLIADFLRYGSPLLLGQLCRVRAAPGPKSFVHHRLAGNAALNHGHIERGMEMMTKPFSVDDHIGRLEQMPKDG